MSTLAIRLKEALDDLPKVSQADLASACGVKPPSVSDWLSGRTKNLKGMHLIKASIFLGVNPEWLQEGKGKKKLQLNMYSTTTGDMQRDALIEIVKQVPQEHLGQLEKNVHAVYQPNEESGKKTGNRD